ncbi:hypothetical protein, partial [Lentzea aerocolonigenes]|uniref:hypothetical protein n=1 Tax=Lentzea aerocolonigenes TaxID=68170 RepID=UPI001B80BDA6
MRFAWLLVSVVALTACTAPPEPPLGSPAPKLDPQAIAYDNLDFNLARPSVFDSTCETLPPNLQSLLGSKVKTSQLLGVSSGGGVGVGVVGPGGGLVVGGAGF